MEPIKNMLGPTGIPDRDTLFSYHAGLNNLSKDVPSNRISMEGVWSEKDVWTQFFFDNRTKNIYTGGFPNGQRPEPCSISAHTHITYCAKLDPR